MLLIRDYLLELTNTVTRDLEWAFFFRPRHPLVSVLFRAVAYKTDNFTAPAALQIVYKSCLRQAPIIIKHNSIKWQA